MDFVAFSTVVLKKLIEATAASTEYRAYGVPSWDLGRVVFGDQVGGDPEFSGSTRQDAVVNAAGTLQRLGLLEQPAGNLSTNDFLQVSARGRAMARDMTPLWSAICEQSLAPDQAALLRIINELGAKEFDDHGVIECVDSSQIRAHLEWSGDIHDLVAVGNELTRAGFLLNRSPIGRVTYCPTYRGLVWQTRHRLTRDSAEIDALVEEGETSTLDFKRQLAVDTASQKGELVKDVIALANARGSGTRSLLIGFTDDGDYFEPTDAAERAERDRLLDALSQDRLQTIVANHTTPAVAIRFVEVAYRLGRVGRLDVLRDPVELPYAVLKPVGSRERGQHRVEAGQVFVRDGAVTREARPEEIEAMRMQAERVRSLREVGT